MTVWYQLRQFQEDLYRWFRRWSLSPEEYQREQFIQVLEVWVFPEMSRRRLWSAEFSPREVRAFLENLSYQELVVLFSPEVATTTDYKKTQDFIATITEWFELVTTMAVGPLPFYPSENSSWPEQFRWLQERTIPVLASSTFSNQVRYFLYEDWVRRSRVSL